MIFEKNVGRPLKIERGKFGALSSKVFYSDPSLGTFRDGGGWFLSVLRMGVALQSDAETCTKALAVYVCLPNKIYKPIQTTSKLTPRRPAIIVQTLQTFPSFKEWI